MANFALAVHGGAGTIRKTETTLDQEEEYRRSILAALETGRKILAGGGTALDAVEACVVVLEDDPLFNAGRGSVFTHEGKIEMDAAIMDGKRLKAGAIAAVRNVKNPIRLARKVMEESPHIFLLGDGADRFAEEVGVDLCDSTYFFTERRWNELENAIAAGKVKLDHSPLDPRVGSKPLGTVGAVALDSSGCLAAATSTGGMTNKKFGRVGDTPIIGAGTYADDLSAVSCTGHGEFFILGVAAYDVSAQMRYKNETLAAATAKTIGRIGHIGGEGGLIAVDSKGNIAMPFNSEGMYRGYVTSAEAPVALIYC
ncbi:MAG: beta-aspartyl-peptidase [Blastocatellia bacterium]